MASGPPARDLLIAPRTVTLGEQQPQCRHAYCRHYRARELESSGQPLEADRIFSENRLVRCRLTP
jgi:hypothetical protein